MLPERDVNGRLLPGSTANPNGRAPAEREAAYRKIRREIIGEKEYRTLWQEAFLDARGKRISHVKDEKTGETKPQLIDDPDSTPSSRTAARKFIEENLVGKPIQTVITDDAGGELWSKIKPLFEEMQELDDGKLEQIVADAYAVKERTEKRLRKKAKKPAETVESN